MKSQEQPRGAGGRRLSESATAQIRTPIRRRRQLARWLALGDAVLISVAVVGAYITRSALGRTDVVQPLANEVPAALAVMPLWLTLFYLVGAYRPEYLNAGGDAFRRFIAGVIGGVLALGFTSFLLNLQLSRLFVAFLALYTSLAGGALRVGVRSYLRRRYRRGELIQRTLIVGTDPDARELATSLDVNADSAYRVVGYLDEHAPVGSVVEGRRTVLGSPEDAFAVAREHAAGVVIISPSGLSSRTLREVTIALEGTPVDLAIAPSLFQVVTRRVTIESVGFLPILHVDQVRLERHERFLKRAVDIVVAATMLVVTAPLWLVAAALVRRSSPGPVLFRQERVGQDGRRFEILKFRTMVADAQERLADIAHLNEAEGAFFKVADDPRVTPAGRTLRRWSIDELPQLLNVLRGDMSMVGPRPPLPSEVATYEDWHLRRLRVRPGITGIWQVSGRSDVPFDEAVRLDLFYIENWSLGTDIALLFRTVRAVLSRRGAR